MQRLLLKLDIGNILSCVIVGRVLIMQFCLCWGQKIYLEMCRLRVLYWVPHPLCGTSLLGSVFELVFLYFVPSQQVPKKTENETVLDLNRQKKVDSGGGKCCQPTLIYSRHTLYINTLFCYYFLAHIIIRNGCSQLACYNQQHLLLLFVHICFFMVHVNLYMRV